MTQPESSLMSRLVSLSKRRGFVYPASEIYGGLNGFWDFGPLGVQLKNNLRDAWWRDMVECPPIGPDGKPLSIVGLDSSIIQHPQTWIASGHVGGFADLMTDCRETKKRYRADHLSVAVTADIVSLAKKDGTPIHLGFFAYMDGDEGRDAFKKRIEKEARKAGVSPPLPALLDNFIKNSRSLTELLALSAETLASVLPGIQPVDGDSTDIVDQILKEITGPDASQKGTLTRPRPFNLMFHSYVGVFQNEEDKVYLRPETAQGIFLQYKNVLDTSRVRPPFGVAQVGKAFRNEVTPRNFIFRTREFEQMEMEFFCPPEDGMMWYEFWVTERMRWWEAQGIRSENLKRNEIPESERAFYSAATSDIEFKYPFTDPNFGELEGVAYRTDYDLKQHQTHSKVGMDYFDQEQNRRYIPHVVEPASGLTRGVLALLSEAYQYDESRASPEWLKLKPSLAPVKLGIFPLVNKDGMPEIAEKLYMDLRKNFICQYDAKQSIGKRYARMDEAGTPFCITIDGETVKNGANGKVTIRIRDTAQQETVALDQVKAWVAEKLAD